MKKIFLNFLIIILFSTKSFATDGRGEIQLSEKAVSQFLAYIKGHTSSSGKTIVNKPLVFWVTTDGSSAYWWYCPYSQCTSGNASVERKACEESTGLTCKRFARGRYVRWDNGINPKGKKAKFSSKMSDNEVRAKLTTLGFYRNDLSSKAQKDQSDNKSVSEKDSLVKQLENLSILFENGKITEKEFIAAKKKLLE